MPPVLSIPSFGRGIVREGSSDAQRTDELRACDSYNLSERGQLVVASDLSDFVNLVDGVPSPLQEIHGVAAWPVSQAPRLISVGDNGIAGNTIYVHSIDPTTGAITLPTSGTIAVGLAAVQYGLIPTFAPFFDEARLANILLINIGARSFRQPRTEPGLYALVISAGFGTYSMVPISTFDALGTGNEAADHPGGTHGKQLFFRGIAAYNRHAFGFGFLDGDATNGDGPSRVMFSNVSNVLKWGNDPADTNTALANTDRAYKDSDAVLVGGEGSVVRAAVPWGGRLWLGAADGLHYIEGFGRESFDTNGVVPVRRRNVIGPRAMIEGPDGMLHAVGDDGHWIFGGDGAVDPVGLRLRDFHEHSNGYWDLIWTDTSRAASYPGQTNQDLVWMMADRNHMQVWIGIPWCSIANGYGYGSDTVVIKYNCLTGGYTRQLFPGQILTSGAALAREAVSKEALYFSAPGSTPSNLRRYGWKATQTASPVLPTSAPLVTFGEYAPHGADGAGIVRKNYLTIAWEQASSLPLVFTVTPSVDGKALTAYKLTIGAAAPGSPAHGDYWVDTSGTDTNLGNGTAGVYIPASPNDFLLKRWHSTFAKWVYVPGMGQQGTRVSVPLAHDAKRGTRVSYQVASNTVTGRYQIEGFGVSPTTIRAAG